MSATTATQISASIHVVGGLLPADMLLRIMTGKDVSGSTPADYHVVGVRSVKDDAERHWDYLKGAWRVLRDAIGLRQRPARPRHRELAAPALRRARLRPPHPAARRHHRRRRHQGLPGQPRLAAPAHPPRPVGPGPRQAARRRRRCPRSRWCRNA